MSAVRSNHCHSSYMFELLRVCVCVCVERGGGEGLMCVICYCLFHIHLLN